MSQEREHDDASLAASDEEAKPIVKQGVQGEANTEKSIVKKARPTKRKRAPDVKQENADKMPKLEAVVVPATDADPPLVDDGAEKADETPKEGTKKVANKRIHAKKTAEMPKASEEEQGLETAKPAPKKKAVKAGANKFATMLATMKKPAKK